MALDRRVVSSHFPYIPVSVQVRQQRPLDVEALVDTGFDGQVIVPSGAIAPSERPDGHLRWQLADGSVVLAPFYLGTVRVGDLGPYPVVVSVLGDEAIVGRGLTNQFRVILEYGQLLIVEP